MATLKHSVMLLRKHSVILLTHALAYSLAHSLTAQAGAAARAERLREWHALAVGNTISGRDVGLALQELEELQVGWLSPLSCSKYSMALQELDAGGG